MKLPAFIFGLLAAVAPALYAQYGAAGVPNPYTASGPSTSVQRPRQVAIARISAVQGDVNVRRNGAGAPLPALINAPLTARDRLETSVGSRAEIEFDPANLVRLAPDTEIELAGFEYRRYEMRFRAGTILYRVSHDAGPQVEIQMPGGLRAAPQQEGEYRICVLENGGVRITVRSGRLEVFSPSAHLRRVLSRGQTWLVRSASGTYDFQPSYEPVRDHFDDWSAYRDRQLASSEEAYPGGGWKRFGDPGADNRDGQAFREGDERSGWHSFGQAEHGAEGARR